MSRLHENHSSGPFRYREIVCTIRGVCTRCGPARQVDWRRTVLCRYTVAAQIELELTGVVDMNVFISADLEGICGVCSLTQWEPGGSGYARACEWMTGEVNAAVEGAVQAGAKKIVVKDAHCDGNNIDLEKLHPAAELISGWGPLNSMVEGVGREFNALILIGYHARGATADGTFAHTWSRNVLDLQVNGVSIGEAEWAAAFAGHFGVPVAMIAGDDKLAGQVRATLPAGFHFVVTKTGWAFNAARMRPIAVVRKEIRETAARALGDTARLPVYRPELPVTVTLRFRHWEGLHACEAVPNVKRLSVDTFQYRGRGYPRGSEVLRDAAPAGQALTEAARDGCRTRAASSCTELAQCQAACRSASRLIWRRVATPCSRPSAV